MKRIIFVLLALVMMGNSSFAQKEVKVKKSAADQAAAPMNTPQKAAQPKMKKDGTADKRFKENKQKTDAAKPAGPLKKDGTPDMRYKANKEASKKK